jgi:hypothetical protein
VFGVYLSISATSNAATSPADNVDTFAIAALHGSVNDPGTLVPITIAQTIVGSPTALCHALEFIGAMKGHRSARVRETVA